MESQHGIAFKRFHNLQKAHEDSMNNYWGADDWARFPDIYDNYKKWYALRNDTWEEEMATLEVRLIILNILFVLPIYIFKKTKIEKR